jgi:hypothetical protein
MSVGTRRQNSNPVLEITVSFLGIHKWEPDIYIGFSSALHLQCGICSPPIYDDLYLPFRCIQRPVSSLLTQIF